MKFTAKVTYELDAELTEEQVADVAAELSRAVVAIVHDTTGTARPDSLPAGVVEVVGK